ncbi:hypothetical protein JCM8115_005853 [Rhodotorula mucilaginosa]|uniref:Uncharacterized protein n=1 Tax=Rhodotorula mucilaginosa TaxID=5537 RepID=A0A9P7B8R6_RHOMI|nr:hypothetical protein C6P46_001464 [Rhodotorula mucilaginosa]TKA57106.1 hypothetical protein B0A53_01062 [Rhodotorula sp. CCFEE 5036]
MLAATVRRSSPTSLLRKRAYATVPPAGPAPKSPQAGGIKTETMVVGGIGAVLVYYIGKSMFAAPEGSKESSKA